MEDKNNPFYDTPLYDFAKNGKLLSEQARQIFERETSQYFRMYSGGFVGNDLYRNEFLRPFILKMLLYIGTPPLGNCIPIIGRLIETMTFDPGLTPNVAMAKFAVVHNCDEQIICAVVDKAFCINNTDLYERIRRLIGSSPLTPKDVLSDLSVYARLRYF